MLRRFVVVLLAAGLALVEPRMSPSGFTVAAPAQAGEAPSRILYDLAGLVGDGSLFQWQGWSGDLGWRLGEWLAPPSFNSCSLLIFCRRTFRGFERVTRTIVRAPVRVVRTAARTTPRVARRVASTTTRLASRAVRSTARVAAGAVIGVAGVTVGAVGAVTGIRVPPRRRGQAEFAVKGLRPAAKERLAQRGYLIVDARDSALLGGNVTRLRAPDGLDRVEARQIVAAEAPDTTIADNDLFLRPIPGLYRSAGNNCGRRCETFDVTQWTRQASRCSAGTKIGVVDTGVDITHPSLADARVTIMTARSADLPESDMDHGTAVVSLLVGQPGTGVEGLVPGAHVFAADAFHGLGSNAGADVFDLIFALDWLADEGVSVVNLSLSGPDNPLLRDAVRRLQERGIVVVAASGQPGRGAEPIGYPGKYTEVITVSAIDSRLRPSRLAMRGDHIAFTAPGVGLTVAHSGGRLGKVDGTSFAAPFLTAAYAMASPRFERPSDITERLAESAKDLGAPGRDPVYGWGLVQFSKLPGCE